MHTMNGAQLIIKLLERRAIEVIAGIPGGANLPLYAALSESKTIRHVLCRHEQGAGFLAQGMARSSGKAAVCFATIARGFGMRACNAEQGCNVGEILTAIFAEPGPCLVNVPIGREEEVYPMVPPGASNSIMLGGCNAEKCA